MTRAAQREPSKHERSATDPDLMRALAAGDLGALGVLFDRYHEDVRQFLRRVAGDADADDLVQETFLTASRAAASYDGRPSARPFLIGVAAQLARRKRRTFARWCNALAAFGMIARPVPRSPEESTSLAQDGERIRAALDRLSHDKRVALVLVEWEGLSGEEAATALGIPVGTLWRRLHDARIEIRRAIAPGRAA